MQGVWRDFSYGFRGLRKEPSFTLLAMLTLALGIGASTTIFSVIQNVLLDPFPYTDAEKVVQIQIHDTENARPGGRTFFQLPEFLDYSEQSNVFEEVIGGTMEDVLYTTGDGTELFTGGKVTGNVFHFLGVPPLVGRGITPEDAKPAAPPVFVLAYKAWVKYFNQDPVDPRPQLRAQRRSDDAGRDHAAALHQAGRGLMDSIRDVPRRPEAQPPILHVPGQAQAGHHQRPGAGGGRYPGAAARQAVSRQLPQEFHRTDHELGRHPRRASSARRSTRWRRRSACCC